MLQFLPDSTVLFALAVSSAAMELGLTAYLMIAGTHVRGGLYHSLFVLLHCLALSNSSVLLCRQIIFLFDALWTVLFLPTCVLWYTKGSLDVLANLFGSICWIFAAAIVWVLFSNSMLYPVSESCVAGIGHRVCSQQESKEKLYGNAL
jgi:hypothetical protein